MADFNSELPKIRKLYVLAVSSEGILLESFRSRKAAVEASEKYSGDTAIAELAVPEVHSSPLAAGADQALQRTGPRSGQIRGSLRFSDFRPHGPRRGGSSRLTTRPLLRSPPSRHPRSPRAA